jgi:pyruvate/2-oxoglutarate/acetoin dehydrogenase E1 component
MIDILQDKDITPEIFDVGSLKKYDLDIVVQSLHRTKKLLLID